MNKGLLLLIALTSLLFTNAQSPKHRVLSLPAQKNGVQLRMPWTGGMDSPEFSEIDLNGDGVKDLFVFDKVGSKVLTFLNSGGVGDTMYTYAPQYETLFPTDLSQWALLIDYNHDGIPDIFTHSSLNNSSGIRVYKGSMQQGYLHYDLVCPLVRYYDQGSNPVMFSNINDIPAITDVNRDGDVDILSYGTFGSTIAYYENQSVENPGNAAFSPDSFKFNLITSCWGNIAQNLSSNSISLNQSCKGGSPGPAEPRDERHAGNSLFPVIDPTYHTVDLLNGNLGYANLLLLRNCGDPTYANVCSWDSVYPSCNVPMFMATYPAAFGVDVSGDGLQDILMSPNVPGSYVVGGGAGRNIKNVMYYKNTGDSACLFEYQSDSFLIRHSLDFGSNSRALFYDFNGDGLQDIVVGSLGYFQTLPTYTSTVGYYENVGTATQPLFNEVSTNYNNISQYNLVSVNPGFGDLDGDGKKDMLIGDAYGYLYFFKNAASTGSSFPSMTASQYFGLSTGLYSAPFIYDLNGDSLNDILVGDQTGKITYFWNYGTKNNPLFNEDSSNTSFGNVNVTQSGQNAGYSQPYISKDSAGNALLFVGSLSGHVFEYMVDPTKLRSGSFAQLSTDFIGQEIGAMSTISIADINNDGKSEYLVGNARGGLLMFSDSVWDPGTTLGVAEISNSGPLKIYPNPAKEYFVCAAQNDALINPKTEVFNVLGELMKAETSFTNGNIKVNTTALTNGFYIVRITDQGKLFTAKIMIEQ